MSNIDPLHPADPLPGIAEWVDLGRTLAAAEPAALRQYPNRSAWLRALAAAHGRQYATLSAVMAAVRDLDALATEAGCARSDLERLPFTAVDELGRLARQVRAGRAERTDLASWAAKLCAGEGRLAELREANRLRIARHGADARSTAAAVERELIAKPTLILTAQHLTRYQGQAVQVVATTVSDHVKVDLLVIVGPRGKPVATIAVDVKLVDVARRFDTSAFACRCAWADAACRAGLASDWLAVVVVADVANVSAISRMAQNALREISLPLKFLVLDRDALFE